MRTVNMHEAKTNLSRLVEAAANGEPFIIARAGTPIVKVIAVEAPEAGDLVEAAIPPVHVDARDLADRPSGLEGGDDQHVDAGCDPDPLDDFHR